MYCIKCGIKLSDTEKQCPLCGTVPFHPQLEMDDGEALYPENKYPKAQPKPLLFLIVVSTMFIVSLAVTLLCDLQINRTVTWSGLVAGALLIGYIIFIFPLWFRRPNPVIIAPCVFVATGLYLAYINYYCKGDWFLGFAFPLVGGIALITCSVITLLRYLRRGKLFIFAGAFFAMAGMMFPMEILINITFHRPEFVFWSLYPITALSIFGAMLIFLALFRPAREAMERKFFV